MWWNRGRMVKREKSKQKNLEIYSSLKAVIINTVSFFVISSIVMGISNWSEAQSLILKTSEYLGLIRGSLIAGIIMSFFCCEKQPRGNPRGYFYLSVLKTERIFVVSISIATSFSPPSGTIISA